MTKRDSLALLLCIALALLVFAVYALTSATIGGGQPIMPLDDAYIHFQYAHQIASGHPYVYNPGLPPTSGATSFLYPYLLAVGNLLGFRALALGWWAMLLGAAALAAAAWLVYRIVALSGGGWLALVFAAVFALDGWIGWHFMSGMETGWVVLFVLLVLYAVLARRFRLSIAALTLLALIRPEGGALAVIGAVIVLVQSMQDIPVRGRFGIPPRWLWRREWLLLLIPIAAVAVQPLVNYLLTGSAAASGSAAKSLFGMIPYDLGVIIERVLENFIRMWREFLTVHFYVFGMAVLGWLALLLNPRFRLAAVMVALWLLAGTLAISTLDTAFWHFKRYQIPLIALFFPLAGWGWAFVYTRLRRLLRRTSIRREPFRFAFVLAVFGVLIAVSISSLLRFSLLFVSNEALNVGYVVAQPLQMAHWLAENAPESARVAVHDVGMMRYMGGRETIDIVGLTTPSAASYWRSGPGAVGEFIERQRPDLIASYGEGHGFGLGYLQNTDLYAETLATYTVELDPLNNVALAAPTQGIYRPDWTAADRAPDVQALPQISTYLDGRAVVDSIDVADIASETDHHYDWRENRPPDGFPTEYYQFSTIGCVGECAVIDGGRLINGEESFTLEARPNADLILVTRVHPAAAGTFDVYANDTRVATRVIPALPGAWLEIPTLIPASLVTENTRIRIVPNVAGDYMPYYHWAYQGEGYQPPAFEGEPLAVFQSDAVQLISADLTTEAAESGETLLHIALHWQIGGNAQGDAKIFVHVLAADGSIVAQVDDRSGRGGLPPGNWLPGSLTDTLTVPVPAGSFQVVMGLYDPVTQDRIGAQGAGVEADNRVLLGEIEVP